MPKELCALGPYYQPTVPVREKYPDRENFSVNKRIL